MYVENIDLKMITQRMEKQGIRKTELARLANISNDTVYNLFCKDRKRNVSLQILVKVLDALDLKLIVVSL